MEESGRKKGREKVGRETYRSGTRATSESTQRSDRTAGQHFDTRSEWVGEGERTTLTLLRVSWSSSASKGSAER